MEKRDRTVKHQRRQKLDAKHQQRGRGPKEEVQDKGKDDGKSDKNNEKIPTAEKKVIDHTAIPDPHMFDNLKRETDDIAALTTKTFSKHQVFSNWSRYEPPTGSAEEEDQKIGADYESLLQSAQIGSHFRFKSERGWDPSSTCARSAVFSLNMNTLGDGLSCLPFYERLGLSLSIFSNEELEEMERRAKAQSDAYLPSVKKNSRQKPQPADPEPPTPEPALALYEEEELQSLPTTEPGALAPQLELASQPDSREPSAEKACEPSTEKTTLSQEPPEIPVIPTQPKAALSAPKAISKPVSQKSTLQENGDSLDFGVSRREDRKRTAGITKPGLSSKLTGPEELLESPDAQQRVAASSEPLDASKPPRNKDPEIQPFEAERKEADEDVGVRKQRGKGRSKTNKRRSWDSEADELAQHSDEPKSTTATLTVSKQAAKPDNDVHRPNYEAAPTVQPQEDAKIKNEKKQLPTAVLAAAPQPSTVYPAATTQKPAVSSKEDDQLDFLLSLKKAVPQPTLLLAKPSFAVRSTLDDDEAPTEALTTGPGKKTEELEDWLDSMLGD